MSTPNTISFFWQAKFKDGFTLSQFNEDGTENIIRSFLSKELLQRLDTIPRKSIIGKNLFSKLEIEHGRVEKFGWYPFDHKLANAVRGATENQVAEVKIKSQEIKVPEDCYPSFFRTSEVVYGQNRETTKSDNMLAIGLIKRNVEGQHIHATQYDRDDKLIEKKNDKSFDRKDLKVGRKTD